MSSLGLNAGDAGATRKSATSEGEFKAAASGIGKAFGQIDGDTNELVQDKELEERVMNGELKELAATLPEPWMSGGGKCRALRLRREISYPCFAENPHTRFLV